jgi:uncharacterized protein with NRDE domain
MCTLVVFVGAWPGAPLLVAANRDEMLDRPASAPRAWPGEHFFAPVDERAGGTWLGLHRAGLFVGITNRAGTPPDPSRASRGQLVVEALRQGSASSLRSLLSDGTLARRYNPFHLLYGDTSGAAFVTWFDGDAVHHDALEPGLAVVTERSLGGDDHAREERVRRRLEPLFSRDAAPALEELAPVMREHDDTDRIASTCVHVPALGYGTRSSLLLDVRPDVASSRWLWAEGAPCSTPYAELPVAFA